MKRRNFLQTIGLTSLSICSVGLVTGCKNTASKVTSEQGNLYPAEFIQTITPHAFNGQASNKEGYLKVEKSEFLLSNSLAVAYQNQVIGLIKLNDKAFAASLLVCPHRGCAVEFITPRRQHQNSYICPCHGARFTETGQVSKGPATESLTKLITHTDPHFVYIHILNDDK